MKMLKQNGSPVDNGLWLYDHPNHHNEIGYSGREVSQVYKDVTF